MQIKSQLHIVAGYKNHKTFLQHSYCSQPFKLANITEEKNSGVLQLMIRSSAPGVLNHDQYTIDIAVEENACLQLFTQGYQRLFTMNNQASQSVNVEVRNNGSLCFLPHPGVPHAASNFSCVNNIYLNKSHSLIWSDIITCGRKLSGEEFKFTRYQNVTNIYIDKKLVVKENILLEPLTGNIHGIGQLEGYTHQSTLLFIHDHAGIDKIAAACDEYLAGIEDVAFGISSLAVNGLICRVLGRKSEQLFLCNNKLASIIQQFCDDSITLNPKDISLVTPTEIPQML